MTILSPRSTTDTSDDTSWAPLRVEATMAEPIVTDRDPLHLDGPLSWAAYLDHQDHDLPLPPMTPEQCVDFALPLATWTRPHPRPGDADDRWLAADGHSTWGWCCSAGHAPAHRRTVAHTRRPVPVRELARYTTLRTVNTGAGPYKARNVPHAAQVTPTVTWWCLGDPDRLTALLDRPLAIGRLRNHGHGRILRITVTEDHDAHRRWRWRQWPDPDSPTVGACRAPYHHPTRRMPVTPLGAPPWA